MKTTITRGLLVGLFLAFLAAAAWAADYAAMSTEELSRLRCTFANASQEERLAFHAEWQKRLSRMSPEELAKYTGPGRGQGQGQGRGMGPGKGMGQGAGAGSAN